MNAINHEHYRYARAGARVMKISREQQVRYLPGLEIRLPDDRHDLRVLTINDVRILHWPGEKPAQVDNLQIRFSQADRGESSILELDGSGRIISREIYYPFGGTAQWATRSQAASCYKTQRYAGKERDVSGLIYYGFRYYAPWLLRWLNTDPAGKVDGLNLFRMVRNNPVTFSDQDGRMPVKENFREVVRATHQWMQRIFLSGTQGGSGERNQTILGIIPVVGFAADSVSKYLQRQAEQDSEFRALGNLVGNVIAEIHPIEDEMYRLKNITIIGENDQESPAYTYTRREENRKLYFSSHGSGSADGGPVINDMEYSAERFYRRLKRFHENFDADFDTLVVTCCNTPEGAASFGAKLHEITGKNILIYSGEHILRRLDPQRILKAASNMLASGSHPHQVTDHIRNEQRNGRNIYGRMVSERNKFIFFGSYVTRQH